MIHVTCRLTDKNRDQLRNPTLGNRVLATFTFLNIFYKPFTGKTMYWKTETGLYRSSVVLNCIRNKVKSAELPVLRLCLKFIAHRLTVAIVVDVASKRLGLQR